MSSLVVELDRKGDSSRCDPFTSRREGIATYAHHLPDSGSDSEERNEDSCSHSLCTQQLLNCYRNETMDSSGQYFCLQVTRTILTGALLSRCSDTLERDWAETRRNDRKFVCRLCSVWCDDQNISVAGLQTSGDSKLLFTILLDILWDSISIEIRWIKVTIVQMTRHANWASAREWVTSRHRNAHFDRFVVASFHCSISRATGSPNTNESRRDVILSRCQRLGGGCCKETIRWWQSYRFPTVQADYPLSSPLHSLSDDSFSPETSRYDAEDSTVLPTSCINRETTLVLISVDAVEALTLDQVENDDQYHEIHKNWVVKVSPSPIYSIRRRTLDDTHWYSVCPWLEVYRRFLSLVRSLLEWVRQAESRQKRKRRQADWDDGTVCGEFTSTRERPDTSHSEDGAIRKTVPSDDNSLENHFYEIVSVCATLNMIVIFHSWAERRELVMNVEVTDLDSFTSTLTTVEMVALFVQAAGNRVGRRWWLWRSRISTGFTATNVTATSLSIDSQRYLFQCLGEQTCFVVNSCLCPKRITKVDIPYHSEECLPWGGKQ